MEPGDELRHEIAALAQTSGCELLEIESRGSVLRLVLDRPEGVTLSDCESISKQVSALLDVADFGRTRYVLEVTSPGLDRKLYGPRDYERFRGRQIRVTWKSEDMPTQRTLVGRLEEFRPGDGGELAVADEATHERHLIPLTEVSLARLVPEF